MAGTFNPNILLLNATMADLPLHMGYSPAHWQKGLNVMLEKSPGNFNVEKFCIILTWRNFVLFYCSKQISILITNGLDVQSC